MKIDVDHEGGVLIEGDTAELEALAGSLIEAAEHGDARGHLLAEHAAVTVTVRRLAPCAIAQRGPGPLL
jgi:hypothetical protein